MSNPQQLPNATSALPRRPRKDDDEMDITPMIDVTFLLLIFFIVAARLDPQAAINLASAKHGHAVPEKNCVVIVLTPGDAGAANIFLGSSKDPSTLLDTGLNLEEQEDAMASYIDQGLHGGSPKKAVLIKSEKEVSFRHVYRVQQAAARVLRTEDGETIHVGVKEET